MKQTQSKIKQLVKARLAVLPSDVLISVGGFGSFSKEEMISHVEKEDEIGRTIAEIEMDYLRSLKKGIFYA